MILPDNGCRFRKKLLVTCLEIKKQYQTRFFCLFNSQVHSALSFRARLSSTTTCSLNRRAARTRPGHCFYYLDDYMQQSYPVKDNSVILIINDFIISNSYYRFLAALHTRQPKWGQIRTGVIFRGRGNQGSTHNKENHPLNFGQISLHPIISCIIG